MGLYRINNTRQMCFLLMVTILVCQGNSESGSEYISNKVQESVHEDELMAISRNEKDFPTRIKRSSTIGLVDIAKFKYSTGIPMTTYVDDTMTRLLIKVAVSRSKPGINAIKPSGVSITPTMNGTASQGTVVAIFDVPITPADLGIWRFAKTDANTWDVTIQGESPVYITHQLFELGSSKPITDHPVIAKSYKLEITVEGMSNVQSVDIGFLYTKEKIMPIGMVPLTLKSGSTYEAAKVTMPSEAVMVGIQGKDKSGHPYKRLETNEIIPVSLKLEVPFLSGAFVEEHTSLNITFTVTNIISTAQDIDVRITDDLGLVQNPKVITSNNLKPNNNFTGHFVLNAGNGGVTTLVKIEARQNFGGNDFSSGPIELRNITVFRKTTTTTSTTSASTTTTASITTKAAKPAAASNSPGSPVPSVSNAKLADVARITDTALTGKVHYVFVDATMTRLIFQATVKSGKPVIIPTTPSGVPYSGLPSIHNSAGTVTATLDIPINSSEYGLWKFEKLDNNIWEVKIQAESPVYITQQLFKPGSNVPLNNPIPGKPYDLDITVTGLSHVTSVDQAFLVLKKDSVAKGFAALVHKGGSTYVASNVKVPSEVFIVGIQGKDNAGHPYRRIDPTEIKPLSLELDVQPSTGALVEEHTSLNITYTVTNIISTAQDIEVRIADDVGLVHNPKVITINNLKPNDNFTGHFILNAGNGGVTTLVKIEARQNFGGNNYSSGPIEVRNITVFRKTTTTTSTTSASTTTTASITTKAAKPAAASNSPGSPVPSVLPAIITKSTSSNTATRTHTVIATPSSSATTQPPMSASKKSLISVDVGKMQANVMQSPASTNKQLNQQKKSDSYLLMLLTMFNSDKQSIHINANI